MIFSVADGLEPIPAVMVKEAFSKKKPPSEPGSETVRGGRQGRKIGQCYRTLRNNFGEVKGKKLLVTPWRCDESVPYMCLFKTAKTQTQPEKLKSYSQCWSQAWINV